MTTVNLTQRSSITEEDVKIRFRKILKVTRSLHEQNYMHGWLVGWLCLTYYRQQGHLETAPNLLFLAKDMKLNFSTYPFR